MQGVVQYVFERQQMREDESLLRKKNRFFYNSRILLQRVGYGNERLSFQRKEPTTMQGVVQSGFERQYSLLRKIKQANKKFDMSMRDHLFLESEREEEKGKKNQRGKMEHISSSLLILLPNVALHVHLQLHASTFSCMPCFQLHATV